MAKKRPREQKVAVGASTEAQFPVSLNILGYRDDDEWVALALEMDIRGYGASFGDALEDLRDLVFMQISFAHFKGQSEMILKPADPIWFERFAAARQDVLAHILSPESAENADFLPAGMELPSPHVIAKISQGFDLVHAEAL
jgi:hypothetical protein